MRSGLWPGRVAARPMASGFPERLVDLEAHRVAPLVPEGDLVHREAGGHTPLPGGVAEAHAAGHEPALLLGYAEDPERLLHGEDSEDRREGRADDLGAGCQLRAPHRREDRTAAAITNREREEVERGLLEMIGEVVGRSLDAEHLRAVG